MTRFSRSAAPLLIAATALASAMPAQAHPGAHYDRHAAPQYGQFRGEGIEHRIEQLRFAVARADGRADSHGRISMRESAALRRDVMQLGHQYRQLSRDGLSRGEVRYLDQRIESIRTRLTIERRDRDDRRW